MNHENQTDENHGATVNGYNTLRLFRLRSACGFSLCVAWSHDAWRARGRTGTSPRSLSLESTHATDPDAYGAWMCMRSLSEPVYLCQARSIDSGCTAPEMISRLRYAKRSASSKSSISGSSPRLYCRGDGIICVNRLLRHG